jgi:hypothetical protein
MFSFLKNKASAPQNDQGNIDKPGAGWFAQLKSGLARTGDQLTGLFGRGG